MGGVSKGDGRVSFGSWVGVLVRANCFIGEVGE